MAHSKYTIRLSDQLGTAWSDIVIDMNKHERKFAETFAAIKTMEILEETIEEEEGDTLFGVISAELSKNGHVIGEYRQLNWGILNVMDGEHVTAALAFVLRVLGLESEPDVQEYLRGAFEMIRRENAEDRAIEERIQEDIKPVDETTS